MNDPSFRIPEPSLPEHNLLREAGSMPQLSSRLRDRVLLNCQQQVRYGRWVDRLRTAATIAVACLLVCVVWRFRGAGPQPRSGELDATPHQQTAQHDPPPYMSPSVTSEGADPNAKLPAQGGPSLRREVIPEMRDLNQIIEKLQSRRNVLCGFLPY